MTIGGHIEDGHVVFDVPVVLPNGTKVIVSVQSAPSQSLDSTDEASTLPLDEWLREFDAWVGSRASRNPDVDDSRESMYPDGW
jgi:hypothetical protein